MSKRAYNSEVNGEDRYYETEHFIVSGRVQSKRKKPETACSVRHFLIKFSYGYCHNGRRLVLLRRDCDPPIT